jgi:hypothetical protein
MIPTKTQFYKFFQNDLFFIQENEYRKYGHVDKYIILS